MITLTKSIIGFSALASAGALTAVEPAATPRPVMPAPALYGADGKVADRLPSADGKMTGAQIMHRIQLAHGLAPGGDGPDCRAFAWPNIPAECIASNAGAPRRVVRVISTDAASAPANRTPKQAAGAFQK